MVPDLATAVLSGMDLKEEFIQFAENEKLEYEYVNGKLTLKGKSAHGMEPFKGINAGFKLAQFLVGHVKHEYLQFINDCLADDFFGEKLNISFQDDITGPLTVNAGILRFKKNEEASISLNIRCPVETPYEKTIEKLTETAKKYGFELQEVREKKPHHVDKDEPVIKILQKSYEDETGDKAELLTTGGATYAQFIENGVAFGAVFPGKENTAHQKNEYVEVEDLFKAAAIYANALFHLANLE